MLKGKYYIYKHIRLDTNEIFYIGIGTSTKIKNPYERSKQRYNRNKIWRSIVKRTDYKVEIIESSNDYNYIKEKEKELISLYGQIIYETGTLCNITKGGEGRLGVPCSSEHKEKNRKFMIELNNKRGKVREGKLVINTETGIFYDSIKQAYESCPVGYFRYFYSKLQGKHFNNTKFKLI